MDEQQVRTLLQRLDGEVMPSPEVMERLTAAIDDALTSEVERAGHLRRGPTWLAVAALAALLLAAVALNTSPDGYRLRTQRPAGEPSAGPTAPPPAANQDPPSPASLPTSSVPAPEAGSGTPSPGVGEASSPTTVAAPPGSGSDATTGAAVRIAYIEGNGRRTGRLVIRDLEGNPTHVERAGEVAWPSWSPDGSALAVETDADVRIVGVDGSTVRTFGPGSFPAWSPDGSHIAFSRTCADAARCNVEVVVVRVDGSDLRSLGPGAYPSWMPDGRSVLYTDAGNGMCEGLYFDPCHGPIAVVGLDGTGRRSLGVSGSFPRMSPDGTRLAYASGDPTNSEVLVSAADGRGAVVVSRSDRDDIAPAWLPDSAHLVYTASTGLVLVNADGSQPRALGSGRSATVVAAG